MLNQSKELLKIKIKIKMRKKLIKAGYDSHYILEFFYRREFM